MMARTRGKREYRHHYAGLGQRMLSAFLAALMSVSLLQVSALAAGGRESDDVNQVMCGEDGEHAYYVFNAETGELAKDGNGQSVITSEATVGDFTEAGGGFTRKKTIEQTGENTFDVTLEVQTQQSIVTAVSKSATVLVFDLSNSMKGCIVCGDNYNTYDFWELKAYERYHLNHTDKKDYSPVLSADTRLQAAKDKALDFLEKYAGTDASATRQIAIVGFGTTARRQLNFVNVAGGVGKNSYNQAVEAINNLKIGFSIDNNNHDTGGTNLQAGLKLAENLIDNITDTSFQKNVVLLTDGVPTYRMKAGSNLEDETQIGRGAGGNGDVTGDGNVGSADNNEAAKSAADEIKNDDATLYTICLAASTDVCYSGVEVKVCKYCGKTLDQHERVELCKHCGLPREQHEWHLTLGGWKLFCKNSWDRYKGKTYYYCADHAHQYEEKTVSSGSVTVGYFLGNDIASPDCFFNADDSDKLSEALQAIAEKIEESGSTGQGTQVVDPLPSYMKLADGSTIQVLQGTSVVENATDAYRDENNTILWNLNPDHAATEENSGTTTYTYRLKYSVVLLNNTAGFKNTSREAAEAGDGSYVPANGFTYLSVPQETGDPVKLAFNVPGVLGLKGDFSFVKKAAGDESGSVVFGKSEAAKGNDPEFTIYDENGGEVTVGATYNETTHKSVVDVSGLPSGHTYTMKETKAGVDFTLNPTVYTITVAYGVTTVTADGETVYPSANGMTVENEWDSKPCKLKITKVWAVGESTQLPASITVHVMRVVGQRDSAENGETDDVDRTVTIQQPAAGADGKTPLVWTAEVSNLPTRDPETGAEYDYYLTEDSVSGYDVFIGSIGNETDSTGKLTGNWIVSLTNYETTSTQILVEKTWMQPVGYSTFAVDVQLVQVPSSGNSKVVDTETLNEENNWACDFGTRPTRYGTTTYQYQVNELPHSDSADPAASGTTSTITFTKGDQTFIYDVVTNDTTGSEGETVKEITNVLRQVSNKTVTGTKAWNITDYGQDVTATVTLTGQVNGVTVKTANGEDLQRTEKLYYYAQPAEDQSNSTGYTFSGLPKYAYRLTGSNHWVTGYTDASKVTAVAEIEYTVEETNPTGITAVKNGYNLNNCLTGDVTVKVVKTWEDDDDAAGFRPNSITFELYRGAELVATETMNATHHDAVTEEIRDEVTGEVTGEREVYPAYDEWTSSDLVLVFDEDKNDDPLPKYDETGHAYTYTVVERPVDKYDAGTPVLDTTDKSADFVYTVKNTLKDDYSQDTTVTIHKNWLDGYTKDEDRVAAGVSAEFILKADGRQIESVTLPYDNGDGTYTSDYSFTGLPMYQNGKLVAYTVEENPVSGYLGGTPASIGGSNVWNCTNVAQQSTSVSVSGTKTWEMKDFTADVTADVYVQYDLDGTYTNVPGREPVTVSSSQGGNLTYGWTGLPKFAYLVNGSWTTTESASATAIKVLNYKVTDSVTDFDTARATGEGAGAYDLVNTFQQEYTSVSVTKEWNDGNSATRPENIHVGLYNGTTLIGEPIEVKANDGWTCTFGKGDNNEDTLPLYSRYDETGAKVENIYSAKEVKQDTATGQWVPIADNGTNGDYKVTYVNGKIINSLSEIDRTDYSVAVTKLWRGPAADSVNMTLHRKANGTVDESFSRPVVLTANEYGVYTTNVGNLAVRNAQGYVYDYYVTEDGLNTDGTYQWTDADGNTYVYKAEVAESGLTVTNTVQQKSDVTVAVEKIWDGTTAPTGSEITVQLYVTKGTDAVPVEGKTAVLSAEKGWTCAWTGLDRYYLEGTNNDGKIDTDGHELVYSVKEVGEINGSMKLGNQHFNVTYSKGADGTYTVTNTLTSTDTYSYRVDRYYTEIRDGVAQTPTYKTTGVVSGSEGESVTSKTAAEYKALDGKSDYTFVSATLDGVAQEKQDSYTWTLDEANHTYVLALYYEITTTTPDPDPTPGHGSDDTFTLNVQKVWKGDTAEDRPESITVQLLKDGKAYSTLELSASKDWKGRWVDLSEKYNWTVEELDVPDGYSSDVSVRNNTWTITNTYDGGSVIPEEPVPGGDQPGNPGGDGDDEIIIPDTEVPTGGKVTDPPKTGDAMGLWAAAAALSGTGLGWLTLTGRKRKDEEE